MTNDIARKLNFSPVESRRFGLRVFRDGVVQRVDFESLRMQLLENKADIYIFRVPVESQASLYRLNDLGYPYIIADTLVNYTCSLDGRKIGAIQNKDLNFSICEKNDLSELDRMTSEIFENYQNHYSSNPALGKADIIEGYKEWIRSYVQPPGHERCTFLVSRENHNVGFATCSFDRESRKSIGVLYGVLPQAAGSGIYSDIIRFTQRYSIENEYTTMQVSTQVQNYPVQKVWSREGFYLSDAYLTVHINCMFGKNAGS